jgi:hypothetical protein
LEKDSPCELIALEDRTEKQRSKGHVAYSDFIKDYAAYLNAEFHVHAWPKGELIQL